MVAATLSRRLATPAVRSRKQCWHKNCRSPSSGHRVVSVGILVGLTSLAGWELSTIPARRWWSQPIHHRDAKHVLHRGESDCRGSTDTMWDIRDRVILRLGVTRLAAAPLASFVPPGPRARVRCAAALGQLRGNCWALIVPRSARRYRDQTGTYNRSSLRTACTTSRRLIAAFS
jgi:hypothetical protein